MNSPNLKEIILKEVSRPRYAFDANIARLEQVALNRLLCYRRETGLKPDDEDWQSAANALVQEGAIKKIVFRNSQGELLYTFYHAPNEEIIIERMP